MFDWVRKLVSRPQPIRVVEPDVALAKLHALTSDAAFEDAWEAMDGCVAAIEDDVRTAIEGEKLGEYPMHAARLWLAYTEANSGRQVDETLGEGLVTSIGWALGFDENTVLLGSALNALEAFPESRREAVALELFAAAGSSKPRRYWLLLKVRTEPFVEAVAAELQKWRSADAFGDEAAAVTDEDYVYSPTAANQMAGAFRQFDASDFEVVQRHFDLSSPGARFLVEAIGATRVPAALDSLYAAREHDNPEVREAAERWIREVTS